MDIAVYLPHLPSDQLIDLHALPITITHFTEFSGLLDIEVCVVLSDGLCRFHSPFERARVQVINGCISQPFPECGCLSLTFFI